MNTKKITYQILELAFHPVIVPFISLYILFGDQTYLSLTPRAVQFSLFSAAAISSLLLPILMYLFMLQFLKRNEMGEGIFKKSWSYGVFFLGNLGTYFLLKNVGTVLSNFIPIIFLSASISSVILYALSSKIKYSLPMITLGAFVGVASLISILFFADLIVYLIAFLVISAIAGTLILFSERNSEIQVYSSFAIGFFLAIINLTVLKYIF